MAALRRMVTRTIASILHKNRASAGLFDGTPEVEIASARRVYEAVETKKHDIAQAMREVYGEQDLIAERAIQALRRAMAGPRKELSEHLRETAPQPKATHE